MGKLQGVRLTTELCSILHKVINLPYIKPSSKVNTIAAPQAASSQQSKSHRSNTSPASALAEARQARLDLESSPGTVDEAWSLLSNVIGSPDKSNGKLLSCNGSQFLPLSCVKALKFLILHSHSSSTPIQDDECDKEVVPPLLLELDSALRKTSLSFSPNLSPKPSNAAFKKRMERLRLQDEERSYKQLTTNLKDARSLKDDNVTARSMMYATSVGLNMIVAPVTFGVFMYFFAGQIFTRFFDGGLEDEDTPTSRRAGDTDIRKVIAGVVSGVFMLFVEMILFVIRSHELDVSVRKKSKRKDNRANPFGYTERNSARVYNRDDD